MRNVLHVFSFFWSFFFFVVLGESISIPRLEEIDASFSVSCW